MKAIQFGAGSIGRGFVADLLHQSGYEVVLVDVNQALVDQVNSTGGYDLYLIEEDYRRFRIDNVRAVSPITAPEAVIGEIRDADVITTAVWAENLPRIAPILARGLLARLEAGAPRINVLACENALGNSEILRDAILALGVIDPADLAEAAAFPNTAVDRLVLGAERDGEKVIDVGRDFELVVDATALADPGQEPIRHVIYTADLATYIERKLYIINGGHAWAGYVGHIAGLTIIQDVFFDPDMVAEVRATMLETAALLHVTRGFDLAELEDYIDFAIGRFQTPGISDTVNRVARSPIRKLQRHERLVAPARLCAEHGLSYRRLAHGIGAAYHFDNPDDPQSVELLAYVAANGIEAAVSHFSGLEPGDPVFAAIVAAYHETEAPLMSDSFTNAAGIALPLAVIDTIRANRDHLSELDGAAGDGDHGINMSKGMGLALEQLDGLPDPDMTTGFQTVSAVLMGRIGGSMGPLYGSLFRGLAVASRGREEVDAATMAAMLAKGLASVGRVTDAQVGDKTLMDVLVPATAAFTAAQEAGAPFSECCDALAAAAEAGLESTRHLVARIGRAARLGERSRGHLDAGAASCCLVLTAIARASNDLLDA